MLDDDIDTHMRMAAFEHARMLGEIHNNLTATELKPGFVFMGDRVPLVNPQRGIFKPLQMRFLLSIKTVFPKPGGKVWYDDQREVHRQIFEGAAEFAKCGFVNERCEGQRIGRNPIRSARCDQKSEPSPYYEVVGRVNGVRRVPS